MSARFVASHCPPVMFILAFLAKNNLLSNFGMVCFEWTWLPRFDTEGCVSLCGALGLDVSFF